MVQAAVDAVLKGAPIVSVPSDSAAAGPGPHPSYDIRHVSQAGPDAELHKVNKTTRHRFKRTAKSNKVSFPPVSDINHDHSQHSSEHSPVELDSHGVPREASVDTLEAASHVSQCEPSPAVDSEDPATLDLTLGLGVEPVKSEAVQIMWQPSKQWDSTSGDSTGACSFDLELQL